ncbi:cellulose synthase operon protein YhjQ/BcsQ [Sphingomonas naphthae]|uniref:Cellulose synthase operon protein YhjQ/BcsQ n=1 Tax=Sphingomonas naphthae TaxID=1813468 RepID=A0ABY7TJH0_9SPHN|nr:cellulose synthase operon protein YhjQ/BcsQ [Sphingomonas naphthae]WCT73309.1 cellulose synthase operon protein YhjQ/BcsQ [Sphingomonas naphthae]
MPLLILHSPKGGVGTTTLAANLAAWIARSGRQVLAVDFSPFDNLALHLRREAPTAPPAEHRAWSGEEGVDAPAAPRRAEVALAQRAEGYGTEQLIQEIERALAGDPAKQPLVIADIPSGDQAVVDRLAGRAFIHLCVLAADAGSAALLPMLMNEPPVSATAPRLHYVLNRMDDRRAVAAQFERLLRSAAGDDLVAVIRADEAVNEALAALTPVFDYAPASVAAADIAALADRVAASLETREPAPAPAPQQPQEVTA